ncbi:MAG: Na/H transporter [Burkholderiales bacterium]|jgi:NhaP-type Na+/H+ or K+/H+ antiporter|nr:Na/H transporter [Burkholderiales bacterium]
MHNFFINYPQLVWPIVLLLAWSFGEAGTYLTKIPRITFYMLFGFIFAKHQIGPLPTIDHSGILSLVNIIAGLILFKFGYRINLRWIWSHPIILVTSLVESGITFIAVFMLSRLFGISILPSLEFASLFMATSPFVIMNIVDNEQSAGQVTERILHLTALNCILAIFVFKLISGLMVFEKSGSVWQATSASFIMIVLSTILGIGSALLLSIIIKRSKLMAHKSIILLSIIIILVVGIAGSMHISSIIAALSFGLTLRHMKIAMSQNSRNFGALENLLTLVLFIVIPVNLDWHNLGSFLGLGISLFFSRLIIKTIVVALFSYNCGISVQKGILTGLALTPISIFSILLLDQSFAVTAALNQEFLVISGVILFLELIGPCFTQYALIKARETGPD